jgi:hypothetical protein
MKVLFYYEWERRPAVVVESDDGSAVIGFSLSDDNTWTRAPVPQLLDFVKEGREMSKEEFEAQFGTIGQGLPNLPM